MTFFGMAPVQRPLASLPLGREAFSRSGRTHVMEFFRYSTSIYGGGDTIIGASWDLLPWFVAAGTAFIVVHAVARVIASRRVGKPH